MKLFFENNVLNPKEWAQWISGIIIIILAIAAFLFFMVKPQFAVIKKQKMEIAALNDKFVQYSNFKNSATSLERKKDIIAAIINYYETELVPTQLTEQNVLDEIAKVCANRVKLDKINALNLQTGPAWTVRFSANFYILADFISLLERSFKIASIKIQKGGKYPSLEIEMTVVPLYSAEKGQIVSSASNTYDDFMDILQRISGISDAIGAKVKKLKDKMEIKKDPFSPESEKKKPEKPSRPYIQIDGISLDKNNSMVVINGKIYRVGDTVHEAKILQINKNSIEVLWDSKEFTIRSK